MRRNVPNRGRAPVRGKAQPSRGPGLSMFSMASAFEAMEDLIDEYKVIETDDSKVQSKLLAGTIEKAYAKNDIKALETYGNIHKGVLAEMINTSMTNSLLHRACKAGNLKAVDVFLKCGANVNLVNKSLRRPLHKCYRSVDIARILVRSKAHLNTRDKKGQTPLHRAAIKLGLEVVRELIENGADWHLRDYEGNLPAAYMSDSIMIRQFERLYSWVKSKIPLFAYKNSYLNRLPESLYKEMLKFL